MDTVRADFEQYVLGALLMQPAALRAVQALTPPIVWAVPAHATIFAAMGAIVATQGLALDLLTLAEVLLGNERVQHVGGVAYLTALVDELPEPLPMGALEAAAMLRDRDAASDVVQEVFCVAAAKLDQLRDATRIKPWLYAIARHEIYRRTERRSRRSEGSQGPCRTVSERS